jgi:heat shock protein HtpX
MTRIKTALLLTGLTVLFVLVGQALGGTTGLVIALALALLMNGISYWFSDQIALRMAGAQEVSEVEAPELHSLVTELAIYAGLPKPRVYLIDSPSPNAFATGRDPQHGAVAVTTGILRLLSQRELAGVIAHELAHIKNRDTLIATIVAVIAGAITALADMAQWSMLCGGFGRHDDEEGGTNPLAALLMIIVAPIAAMLIQFAISRQREFAADELGSKIVGDPMALANALRKLEMGVAMRPMVEADPAQASLYIVNPFNAGGLVSLFSTHSPIAERIARLMDLYRRPMMLQGWA